MSSQQLGIAAMGAPEPDEENSANLRRQVRQLEEERDQLREERTQILSAWVMALVHTVVDLGLVPAEAIRSRMLRELEANQAHHEAFTGLQDLFRALGETDEPG